MVLFKRKLPPELPVVAQLGDVIILNGRAYRVEQNALVLLPMLTEPSVR